MKQLTYNPTVAASILLAAVFLEKYPEAVVKTTESKGTDFRSKLKEEGFRTQSDILSILDDEESAISESLQIGILSMHHDITKFENQYALIKLFNGDNQRLLELVKKGETITQFIDSPAFLKGADIFKKIESSDDEETDDQVDGPVTDVHNPDTDSNSSKTPSSDVKE